MYVFVHLCVCACVCKCKVVGLVFYEYSYQFCMHEIPSFIYLLIIHEFIFPPFLLGLDK